MTRARLITTSICLITAGTGLYLLGSTALQGAQQERKRGSNARASSRSRSNSVKPAWRSVPASTPPETEVVPPPPPAPPPADSPILGPQEERKKAAATKLRFASPSAASFVVTKGTAVAAGEAMPSENAESGNFSNDRDPEGLRVRDELKRLRDDADARRAFYDDLRRTVQEVRAGARDQDSPEQSPAPSHPVPPSSHDHSREPASSPAKPQASSEPFKSQPENPDASPASSGTSSGTIDRAAYLRVVRWAKASGAPVPLALGVAWMESRLHTYPPGGAAGEVGMFQIMPARCRIEGWPPNRLKEPEFNAWLGTRLLAQYYREEGSWVRAAAMYVAGPGVFRTSYSKDVWAYINWYASSVNSYAGYFSHYRS